MKYGFVKDRDEAMELLEADLITIQHFFEICHANGWQPSATIQSDNLNYKDTENNPDIMVEKPKIRLVFSKN